MVPHEPPPSRLWQAPPQLASRRAKPAFDGESIRTQPGAEIEPRIHVLTLGVSDLERALAFYRGLGLESPGAFSIGYLVSSKAEVDAVLAQAEAAGATLTDEPHERPWGIYSGYFRDPDGHLWEVIWNPRRGAGAQ